ncbi:uncharacterized protein LOC129694204 [Leucoraja erinacea]|uniref:uncharacterized protein LOC129694204 n=1 Tax=Leucoraja erinaceus TaxID=7782 RepID=UPI0024538302|nr:uncharacterized protein LOC129694204 [Leucoraja erinacea]
MHLRSAALLIFLCCLALRGARSLKGQVQLTPNTARQVEGGELVLNCTVDFPGAMSFTWEKDELAIPQGAPMYRNRMEERHQTIDKKQVSSLRIAKLTECDSGTYHCKVDNMGTVMKSYGTKVAVTRASQTASCQPINMIFIGVSAGVGAALVIALVIVSLRLRRSIKGTVVESSSDTVWKQALQPKLPILANIPHLHSSPTCPLWPISL